MNMFNFNNNAKENTRWSVLRKDSVNSNYGIQLNTRIPTLKPIKSANCYKYKIKLLYTYRSTEARRCQRWNYCEEKLIPPSEIRKYNYLKSFCDIMPVCSKKLLRNFAAVLQLQLLGK